MVRADCRKCWQGSTTVYQKLRKHLPDFFSFLKDACNPSILIPISQSIKDNIKISERKGKQILSVQGRWETKLLQLYGYRAVSALHKDKALLWS